MVPNATFASQYLARVYTAAISWGAPMALYWELYSNNSTVPLVPEPGSGGSSVQWDALQAYFAAARSETTAEGGMNTTQVRQWATGYWKGRR